MRFFRGEITMKSPGSWRPSRGHRGATRESDPGADLGWMGWTCARNFGRKLFFALNELKPAKRGECRQKPRNGKFVDFWSVDPNNMLVLVGYNQLVLDGT
jgi:hypothetical protein